MASVSPRDTEEELIQTIKRVFEGNFMTEIGGAFHKIIEGEAVIMNGGLVADNIYFTTEQAHPALLFKSRHKNMVHEVPVTKIYDSRFGPVLISGKVDGLEGREVQDTKCKFSRPDFQEYIDSYQWRFYEDMLGLDLFYYDFFEIKGFVEFGTGTVRTLPDVTIEAYERLQCVRYRNMGEDCRSMLNDFLDYIANRNFWSLLKTVPDLVTA